MPRIPASVRQSNDSQLGTDVRALGMCREGPKAMLSEHRRADIRRAAVGRASALRSRTDPWPDLKRD